MRLKTNDFHLKATLESGQVFGFTHLEGAGYQGIIHGARVGLSQSPSALDIEVLTGVLTERQARDYFDLDRDLAPLYQLLKAEGLERVLHDLQGLRLIQQNSWEALACFILSSNNNVKRIQHIWRSLSTYFNPAHQSFPSPGQIASSHERVLRQLGLGYRAPFLFNTALFLSTNSESLEVIRKASYTEGRERVLCFPGIGPKVADCVLLYGFQKYEAFPVDVWMLRVMRKLYFKGRKVSEDRVHAFAQKRWGSLAGYLQQYLFHGVRTGLI